MRWDIVAAALAAAIAWTGPAGADKLNKASQAEMQKLVELVAPTGDRIGPMPFGELASGALTVITIEADRRGEYYFNAICDDDCVDLNLVALGADGTQLDIDDADDPAPSLNVMADEVDSSGDPKPHPRPITIQVQMVSCKAAVCAYGLLITRTE
jgi:hypothetical protein